MASFVLARQSTSFIETAIATAAILFKANMVLQGSDCPTQATEDEAINITVKSLCRTVPAAVPGIVFLSGGQSTKLASERLNAMNHQFKSQLPWALSFSYGRALQQPALQIWRGEVANVKTAQQALLHRACCNRAARKGEYSAEMEPA